MTARDWLDTRAKLEAAATEGPWEYLSRNVIETPVIDVSEADWGGEGLHGYRLVALQDSGAWRNEDAEWIADARTSAPAMRKALEAVLELHYPTCAKHSDEWLCDKHHPSCAAYCETCFMDAPCPTVSAITTALTGDTP